jgi:N-acetylglucosaminyldiphosphoundecaprenol N-acetyl-beta-D-mannosaminyltransferase
MNIIREYLFEKIPIDLVNVNEFCSRVKIWLDEDGKKAIYYLNAFGVVTYLENPEYAKAISSGDLIYADGWGPVFAMRIIGKKMPGRVNAADFTDELFFKLNSSKTSVFLLGDKNEVLSLAKTNIEKNYKNIKITGTHNGFFKENDTKKIIKIIKRCKPSLVMIGMGVPKQEIWLNDNYSELPRAVYWCVGGLFNYQAGLRGRAPGFMRENSLEWFYRLLQEPKRLWRRYTITNIKFIYFLMKYLLKKLI